MAKNIAVSDDVYKLLSSLKLSGESFSDTIRRLARTPRLSEITGTKTVTKEQWLSVEAVFKKQEEEILSAEERCWKDSPDNLSIHSEAAFKAYSIAFFC